MYIDALSRSKRPVYARDLRAYGIRAARLHHATDNAFALIRLADAISGLVRDAIEDTNTEAARLLNKAKQTGTIVEIELPK